MTAKEERRRDLILAARGILAGERDAVANAANLAALIFEALPDLNWAGFYFARRGELVLGPFQGRPACVRIGWGKGVCGTAAATAETIIVPDVHAFAGHVACDEASKAELAVPLVKDGQVLGVLDLDSPRPGRFDCDDAACIEALARLWVEGSDEF